MSAAVLSGLVGANLALAGGVLAVIALRAPVRRRFGALPAYLYAALGRTERQATNHESSRKHQ